MIWLFLNVAETKKDPNVTYYSGYSPGFCVLAVDGRKKCMFVSPFEKGMYKGLRNFSFDDKKFRKQMIKYFGRFQKIGINKNYLSLNEAKKIRKLLNVKLIDISKEASKQRIIKSKKEIEKIASACRLGDKVFSEIVRKRFGTEVEIFKYIKKRAIELNVELAFDPVVATGGNAAEPHHIAGNKKLKGFTVIDLGFKYKGYCGDMTRMIYYGKPTLKELKVYNDLLALQKKAIKYVKKGVAFRDVDKMVRDELGKRFVHSLGHGVGVEIHELPSFAHKSKSRVKNGMVFTIEPGVYVNKKYGIRIEDSVAFVSGKVKVLTKSSKSFISKA